MTNKLMEHDFLIDEIYGERLLISIYADQRELLSKSRAAGTPQRGRKMSAQGSALGIEMPRQMTLCKSKSTKTQGFCPFRAKSTSAS
jgi:hypothetical protein